MHGFAEMAGQDGRGGVEVGDGVGGSEIDGDGLVAGIIEAAIFEGGFHALATFLVQDNAKRTYRPDKLAGATAAAASAT